MKKKKKRKEKKIIIAKIPQESNGQRFSSPEYFFAQFSLPSCSLQPGSCYLVLPVLSQYKFVTPVQLILPTLSRNCCSPSKQNNHCCCSNPCQTHLESQKKKNNLNSMVVKLFTDNCFPEILKWLQNETSPCRTTRALLVNCLPANLTREFPQL